MPECCSAHGINSGIRRMARSQGVQQSFAYRLSVAEQSGLHDSTNALDFQKDRKDVQFVRGSSSEETEWFRPVQDFH
jgi:hypothetical protein